MLYADSDDTSIFFKHESKESLEQNINTAVAKLAKWFKSNYLTVNASKTVMQIYNKRRSPKQQKLTLTEMP